MNYTDRWVIVDKRLGIFLGMYDYNDKRAEEEIDVTNLVKVINDEEHKYMYAMFSKTSSNPLNLERACSFTTKREAHFFIMEVFRNASLMLFAKPVRVSDGSTFPHAIDCIRSGLGVYTYSMMTDVWNRANQTIH